MGESLPRIADVAASQHFLISRQQALDPWRERKADQTSVGERQMGANSAGVFQTDRRPILWVGKLMAAVLAYGPEARASHRAALVRWQTDGISGAPIEVTLPFSNLAVPEGVLVHRSRRPTPSAERRGIPVSGPERTLLEACALLGPLIINAPDSAIRQNLTSMDRMWMMLASEGGRGVKGTRLLRNVLRQRVHDTARDSGCEFELLYHMQKGLLPRPELVSSYSPQMVVECPTSSGRIAIRQSRSMGSIPTIQLIGSTMTW